MRKSFLLAATLWSSIAFAAPSLNNGGLSVPGGSGGGSGITALTGDVTASGTGSVAATVNSYNSGTTFGTAAAANTGTSGATLGLLNGNLTFGGANAYGAPASITLTNGTGLPISTGVSGLGTGVATLLAGTPSGTGGIAGTTSPSFTTPALGTPASGVATHLTGTAAGLTAGNVTTNANLTGPITSTGNATAIASQTGTGTKFVVDTSPTLVTPNLGTPSAATLTNATGLPVSTGISGLGTGVATALGVNVGSAGSVVVNNVAATLSAAGAASTPGLLVSGAHFSGGSGTTTFPQLLVQDSTATASTAWSTSGTSLGVNSHTGIGNIIDFQLDGVSQFKLNNSGALTTQGSITISSGATFTWSTKGVLTSPAVGTIQLGALDVNGSPVAQNFIAQSAVTGTNLAGAASTTFAGSRGTGSGASGSLIFQTAGTGAGSTTQNSYITALTIAGGSGSTPGGVTVAGQLTVSGLTTGTNADFACVTAGLQFLIQSSACTISSLKFKEAVAPMVKPALPIIRKLSVDSYRLKETAPANRDPNARSTQYGLIAENIAKVVPECAIYEDDMKTPKSYRQECVIALLVKGLQEQQAEIQELRNARK